MSHKQWTSPGVVIVHGINVWILTIIGIGVTLFSRFLIPTNDRYWEGYANAVITIAVIIVGKWLIEKLKLQFIDLMAILVGGYVFVNMGLARKPAETPPRRLIKDEIASIQAFVENGPVHDGTEVTCDIPEEYRQHNVGGRDGSGLCVFTSIEYVARFQNELRLWDLQKSMRQEPGGGYPQKVDAMLKKYAPGVPYLQYQGSDPTFLEEVLKTGRPVAVTYNGRDPRYHNQTIAHMVTLVHLDSKNACILDNNFEKQYYWMSREEFLARWKGGREGWAVALLSPPPPGAPRNGAVQETSYESLFQLPDVKFFSNE